MRENESLNGAPFEGRRGHRKEKQGREPYCRMNANVSSVDDKIDKLATMLNLCVVNVIEVFYRHCLASASLSLMSEHPMKIHQLSINLFSILLRLVEIDRPDPP